MSNCRKCSIELVGGTRYNSDVKAGINICKSCRSARTQKHYLNNKESYQEKGKKLYYSNPTKWRTKNREWITGKKDGLTHVYMLENEYVGVTNNLYARMTHHKHVGNPTNYRVLYSTKNRADALELEELLHDMGYEGKHNKNLYR